ncbi:hypothetical protein ACP4OV_005765 [Aristida adscensionis]
MPPPSASPARLATHWVAGALAADETIDFSAIEALLSVSPEFLTDGPEAAREWVALRCLQELVSAAAAAAENDPASAAPPATAVRLRRFDPARPCEGVLRDNIGEVGSSRSFNKDLILPFCQDIQNFICIKKPTLPETSLELLREVDPKMPSMASPSPMVRNVNQTLDNVQSLVNISRYHVNTEKPRFPTDNTELQQENLANLINIEPGSFQNCPIKLTDDLDQPCVSHSSCYNHPQEDATDAVGINSRSLESSLNMEMCGGAVPGSARCDLSLQGSIIEPLSEKDKVDQCATVKLRPCSVKDPNPPHSDDVKRLNGEGTTDQSSKDPNLEEPTVPATTAPDFDIINDLNYGSANFQPVEKDLGAASVSHSVSFNGTLQGDKPDTIQPSENMKEHTTMFDHQNGSNPQLDVSGINQVNQALSDDGSILEENTIYGGLIAQTALESHRGNAALHPKVSEANCLSRQNIGENTTHVQNPSCSISVLNSPRDGDGTRINQHLNKQNFGTTMAETSHGNSSDHSFSGFFAAGLLSKTEMPFCIEDQEGIGSLWDSSEHDLCIKCGKDGHLVQCSSCLLAAHDSCFGSSVILENSHQFCSPLCLFTKATKVYQKAKETHDEARKNLAVFLATKQMLKRHDEHQTEVLLGAANNEGGLNGCDLTKRKNDHQTESDGITDLSEESDRKRKRQKKN